MMIIESLNYFSKILMSGMIMMRRDEYKKYKSL